MRRFIGLMTLLVVWGAALSVANDAEASESRWLYQQRLEIGRALLEVQSTNWPSVLPYYAEDIEQLLWRQEGEIHGFLLKWEDIGAQILRLKAMADGRNQLAAKDVKRFERMQDRGYCYLALIVFAAPDVELLIRRGDLRINFEDGASTFAQDSYLYPVKDRPDPFQSTANGAVLISGKADPHLQGRRFFIFVPEQWVDKKVESVEFIGS